MHLAICTIILCSNYDVNVINSLFALVCNISDTDFINNEVRFDIPRLLLKFFASHDKRLRDEDRVPMN